MQAAVAPLIGNAVADDEVAALDGDSKAVAGEDKNAVLRRREVGCGDNAFGSL